MMRWKPVNPLKNQPVSIQIHCSWSGSRHNVPTDDDNPLMGSTTLQELVQRVKKHEPTLYLWDEEGGQFLSCGPNQFSKSEWNKKMVWELIDDSENLDKRSPRVTLDDGREAYVVTIGREAKPLGDELEISASRKILAKGSTYG